MADVLSWGKVINVQKLFSRKRAIGPRSHDWIFPKVEGWAGHMLPLTWLSSGSPKNRKWKSCSVYMPTCHAIYHAIIMPEVCFWFLYLAKRVKNYN